MLYAQQLAVLGYGLAAFNPGSDMIGVSMRTNTTVSLTWWDVTLPTNIKLTVL